MELSALLMSYQHHSTMTKVPFAKYSGCGNDFVLIDHRQPFWPFENKQLVVKLCERRKGIGADGIILLENSTKADFRMRILNADGSEAEMCGNGIRCLSKFIRQLGYTTEKYAIESNAGIHSLSCHDDLVTVDMGIPTEIMLNQSIPLKGQKVLLSHVNTGVPHVVIFVEDLEDNRLMEIAPEIRRHRRFQPRGTNVNFVKVNHQEIYVRTYERGVEGETLACGTGATAVAFIVNQTHNIPFPLNVHTRSGDTLTIAFQQDSNHQLRGTMTGPAQLIYQGTFNLTDWITF